MHSVDCSDALIKTIYGQALWELCQLEKVSVVRNQPNVRFLEESYNYLAIQFYLVKLNKACRFNHFHLP